MEKELRSAIIFSLIILIGMIIILMAIPKPQKFFSPPVYESCSPVSKIFEQLSATGSSKYTLADVNSACTSTPLYADALRKAQDKAKTNAITLCKNSPPQKISCEDSCSPVYTTEPICEIQFPILTEAHARKTDNILNCEITATAKVLVRGEYQCILK